MNGAFHTTRWSVVARSTTPDPVAARTALGELCEAYWAPLFHCARRWGHGDDDARDLVQSFCVQLLQRGGLDGADPEVGRFRHYLRGAFLNFLRNQHRAAARQQRGSDIRDPAADEPLADPHESPDRVFERRYAYALLDRAMAALRREYETPSKRQLLTLLAPSLLLAGELHQQASELAAQLHSTEGAVRVALHRLRTRWRELVRAEIAATVADPTDIDAELRELRACLARGRPHDAQGSSPGSAPDAP